MILTCKAAFLKAQLFVVFANLNANFFVMVSRRAEISHALIFFWTCREAKIHDALLFFDECEAIFEDREKHGSNHVNMLLTEVEKHEGIIIMATNRSAFFAPSSLLIDAQKPWQRLFLWIKEV